MTRAHEPARPDYKHHESPLHTVYQRSRFYQFKQRLWNITGHMMIVNSGIHRTIAHFCKHEDYYLLQLHGATRIITNNIIVLDQLKLFEFNFDTTAQSRLFSASSFSQLLKIDFICQFHYFW